MGFFLLIQPYPSQSNEGVQEVDPICLVWGIGTHYYAKRMYDSINNQYKYVLACLSKGSGENSIIESSKSGPKPALADILDTFRLIK